MHLMMQPFSVFYEVLFYVMFVFVSHYVLILLLFLFQSWPTGNTFRNSMWMGTFRVHGNSSIVLILNTG